MTTKSRVMFCLFVTALMLMCCGCEGKNSRREYDVSDISSVSFVQVDPNGEMTVRQMLEPELLEVFMDEFHQLSDHSYWNDPIEAVTGSAILITFQDGNYYLINHYCTIHCVDGTSKDTWQYYGFEEFSFFWNKYCSFDYLEVQ